MIERIVLLGMMGAGKSEVGKILAARLSLPLFDLDRMIEEEAGVSIAGLFAREGEAGFRRMEKALVSRVCRERRGVLAPGGGALLDPESRESLLGWGKSVYLRATVGTLAARLGTAPRGTRPLLPGGDPAIRLAALLEARRPYYEEADCVLDTDGVDPAGAAERVLGFLRTIP